MENSHKQIREMLEAEHDCAGYGPDHICVKVVAFAELPSRFGDFQVVAFSDTRDGKEHAAIVKGMPWNHTDVPVRLHSECLTGDAIGSLRCDCRDQLESALKMIGEMDEGIVLYLRQEGRGIGLTNKIRAYELQDSGLDTVQANEALGFRDDERDYSIAAHMLDSMRIKSVRLITNNPRKIEGLKTFGINVTGRIPLVIPPNPYNAFYLETKATKSGHLMDVHGNERLPEQADRLIVEGMSDEQIARLHGESE
ncbi:MAG: GTP cyclohydrolase II [Chloroflexi bacterium]|nr:GTP cyclohydrolase II [Chloroflexota bacterium]